MVTIKQRSKNIRRLSTKELKSYASAYRKGMIYKFAHVTALAELKKRRRK